MQLVHVLVAPPAVLLLLAAVAVLLWKRRPRLARTLAVLSGVLLWITATPLCGGLLLDTLEHEPPLAAGAALPAADAIVVLGAGTYGVADEYGDGSVDRLSLERARYAASLQRRSGLPLLVTGGPARSWARSVGDLMREVLVDEFRVEVRWVEGRSESTWENAVMSAPILREAGVQRILLVTHAFHMPRARASFEAQGFVVIPAPTAFRLTPPWSLHALLPSAKGLNDTSFAFHEWLGRIWYAIRGR